MNMKTFKIIVAKLKKPLSYSKYLSKYSEEISKLKKYAYSNEAPYYEVRYEYDDLLISMYKKILISNRAEIIKFIKDELKVKMEEIEDNTIFKGDRFKVEFTSKDKLVIRAFGKRRSYEISTAYDIYDACVANELFL